MSRVSACALFCITPSFPQGTTGVRGTGAYKAREVSCQRSFPLSCFQKQAVPESKDCQANSLLCCRNVAAEGGGRHSPQSHECWGFTVKHPALKNLLNWPSWSLRVKGCIVHISTALCECYRNA